MRRESPYTNQNYGFKSAVLCPPCGHGRRLMAETFDTFLIIRAPGRLIEQLDTAAALRMIDRSDYVPAFLPAGITWEALPPTA